MNDQLFEKIIHAVQEIRSTIREDFREVLKEFQGAQLNSATYSGIDSQWLRPKEAMALVHIKSSKKWKALRESGQVHYLKEGREYRYERNSLVDYMRSKSTLQYTVQAFRKKKS